MSEEEINEALKIIKEPITVNNIEYKCFNQENYEKLLSVYENTKWFVSNWEQALQNIKDLQQKVEEKNKEIDRLNKEYERIYNENCKLRENHNINDITLLDENERLNRIIDNIFKFMQNKYDNSDLTGFTISFMELQDLKELKENKNE